MITKRKAEKINATIVIQDSNGVLAPRLGLGLQWHFLRVNDDGVHLDKPRRRERKS